MEYLDGNAAAAVLEEAFGRDMTVVVAVCGSCGATEELARAHLYAGGPGVVLRCAHCTAILIRVAWTGSYAVDTSGVERLD